MPASGDLVELVHEQTYLGQNVNNVYYFVTQAASTLPVLTTWFETNVVPLIKTLQVDDVVHTNLRARNVFLDSETYEEPLTGTGSQASGSSELPSFMAYALRLDHDNGAVRPGFKRYVGVTELGITDALVLSTFITYMVNLGNMLVNPGTVLLAEYAHAIVGRVCETPNPTPGAIPSCLKYRLPENAGELEWGLILTAEPYAQPTSQNSRKWYT